jgi:uncharacterized protein YyaL (SSP411 family)
MERESFEDEAIGRLLGELYVPIKVDREERPDIDDVYMTACQVFSRKTEGRASGGWPLSVWVDPHTLKPFYVGTYFPPTERWGRPSFGTALRSLRRAWDERRAQATAQAEQIAAEVAEELATHPAPRSIPTGWARTTATALLRFADRTNGGFGGAPKFPQPVYLELLKAVAEDLPEAGRFLGQTLDAMAAGGIFDQVGGGFHRYAVDAIWLVPHFEKMLYDNAQLLPLYAASGVHDLHHREVAERIAAYVAREMTLPNGAFASAQDAEVDAREGGSFLWTPEEFRAVLGGDAENAIRMYGLDRGTNFQDPHHPEEPASNVLFLEGRPELVAKRLGLDPAAFAAMRRSIDARLLAERSKRQQPLLDDKVLAGWNGLMIAGLADASRLLEGVSAAAGSMFTAALAAARAVHASMHIARGEGEVELLRSSRAGVGSVPSVLEDEAAMARGWLALAKAARRRGDRAIEDEAIGRGREHGARLDRRFADGGGGWFDWAEGQNELFVRARSVSDGAVPSGTSLALHALLDLVELDVERERSIARLRSAFAAVSGILVDAPVQAALAVAAIARAERIAPAALEVASSSAAVDRRDDDDAEPSITIAVDPSPLPWIGDAARGVLVLQIPEGWHIDPATFELSALDAIVALGRSIDDGEVWRGTVLLPIELRAMLSPVELSVRCAPCADGGDGPDAPMYCLPPRTSIVAVPLAPRQHP